MHEMSIAQSILEAVETEAGRRPGARVVEVGLRIGEWAGVDPEALRFCFEAMQAGSGNAGPALHIEMVPRTDRCLKCGAIFPPAGPACPECGVSQTAPAGGTELEFAYLEIEEPDASRAGTQSPE
jgi:hydrogenase nickel incorporation protein HypA/HybF